MNCAPSIPVAFTAANSDAFIRRVRLWRDDARARGVVIGKRTHRNTKSRARRRPDPFQAHWAEMLQCLEADPDQTASGALDRLPEPSILTDTMPGICARCSAD